VHRVVAQLVVVDVLLHCERDAEYMLHHHRRYDVRCPDRRYTRVGNGQCEKTCILEVSQAAQAGVAVSSHDKRVVHGDAHHIERALELSAEAHVGARGLGISRRMVVDHDDRGSAVLEGPLNNFSRIQRNMVNRAAIGLLIGDHAIVSVKIKHAQNLDRFMPKTQPQIVDQFSIGLNENALSNWLPKH